MSISRNTPEEVALELRKEACFGCVECGAPFVEYHHIIEWRELKHFDPTHMVAVCPTCHKRFASMSRAKQYDRKRNPINRRRGLIKGYLEYTASLEKMRIGGVGILRSNYLVSVNGVPEMFWSRSIDGEYLFSLRMYARSGTLLLEIINNEILLNWNSFFDFKFKYNFVSAKSATGKQNFVLDFRSDKASIKLTTFYRGYKVVFSNGVECVDAGILMRHFEVHNANGPCFHFVEESFRESFPEKLIGQIVLPLHR